MLFVQLTRHSKLEEDVSQNSDKQLTGSSFRNGLRENESRSYISNYQNMRIYSINIHTSVGSEQINLQHNPVETNIEK